jgi:hypothetical protein
MGIGCSCSSKENRQSNNPLYLCYIITARDVVAKKVVERIPEDQSWISGNERCRAKCPYHFGRDGLWTDKNECHSDDDDLINTNRWCKDCSELETKCTSCNQNAGCTECTQKFGEFEDHAWSATYVNDGEGICHVMDCWHRKIPPSSADENRHYKLMCQECRGHPYWLSDDRWRRNLAHGDQYDDFNDSGFTPKAFYLNPITGYCTNDCEQEEGNFRNPWVLPDDWSQGSADA